MRRRFKENAMKRLIAWLATVVCLAFTGAVLAQEKPAAMPDKPAAAEAAKPAAETAKAEAAKPKVDKGDTTWMMISTALVILMTIPGLALFYGGMVRSKNTLSVLMQVFVTSASSPWCGWCTATR
jgi:Amt family ammonium transporter